MHSTTILLLTIFSILGIGFSLFFSYSLWIFWIQKKENKLLIQFNHLKNKQAIKREKYIDLIETADPSLREIAIFLKQLISNFEDKLEITEKNFLLVRNIKNQSNHTDYARKIRQIKKDIDILTKTINQIDRYALDSKAFKNNSLGLLIKVRAVFVELEDFYLEKLLKINFFNQQFFDYLHQIKEQLVAINLYIGTVNQSKLLTEFNVLVYNIGLVKDWITRIYVAFQKIEKIEQLWIEANQLKSNQNIHFSDNQLHRIYEINNVLEQQISVVKDQLAAGDYRAAESIIEDLLTKSFVLYAIVSLAEKEQIILNHKFLTHELMNKTQFFINSYQEWIGPIINNWKKHFSNNCESLRTKADLIENKSDQLVANQKNFYHRKQNMADLTNKSLLGDAYAVSYELDELITLIDQINTEVIAVNVKANQLINEFWTMNIHLPQLIETAKTVLLKDSLELQKLIDLSLKMTEIIKQSNGGYDVLVKLESEYLALKDQYDIFKIIVEQLLYEKMIFEKIHQHWLMISIYHDKLNHDTENLLISVIAKKEWKKGIEICLQHIKTIYDNLNTKKSYRFFKGFLQMLDKESNQKQ